MKTKLFILLAILGIRLSAQHETVHFQFNEQNLNSTLDLLFHAKAFDAGYYDQDLFTGGKFEFISGEFDIHPSNGGPILLSLKNVKLRIHISTEMRGPDFLDEYEMDWIDVDIYGHLVGSVHIEGDKETGYSLIWSVVDENFSTDCGGIQIDDCLINFILDRFFNHQPFKTLIPEINLTLGTTIFPAFPDGYDPRGDFLSSDENNIFGQINLIAQNPLFKNRWIRPGDTTSNHASESIVYAPGFNAKTGSTYEGKIDKAPIVNPTTNALDLGLYSSSVFDDVYETTGQLRRLSIDESSNKEEEEEREVFNNKIFPNPTTGQLNLELENENSVVTICNMHGQQVYTSEISTKTKAINLSHLTKGMYQLKIKSTSGIDVKSIMIK